MAHEVEEVVQCGVEEVVPEVLQEEGEVSVLVEEVAEVVVVSREEAAVALHQEEEVVLEVAFHEVVVRSLSYFCFYLCRNPGVLGSGVLSSQGYYWRLNKKWTKHCISEFLVCCSSICHCLSIDC